MTSPGIERDAAINTAHEASAQAAGNAAMLSMRRPISGQTISMAVSANERGTQPIIVWMAVDRDACKVRDESAEAMIQAMIAGYSAELKARTASMPNLKAEVTVQDKRALETWPILGHSAESIAQHEASILRFNARSILSGAITATGDSQDIGMLMDQEGDRYAKAVAGWVTQAYWSGVQAATLEVTAALAT
jgi:hypothetical protein